MFANASAEIQESLGLSSTVSRVFSQSRMVIASNPTYVSTVIMMFVILMDNRAGSRS